MRAVLKPMNDTTTIIAEETLADLSSLSRPHTPDLEMATRRHRMVTAWSLSSRVGSVGPFGSGIGGSAAGVWELISAWTSCEPITQESPERSRRQCSRYLPSEALRAQRAGAERGG